ncbi:MAG: glycosyltransferase family 9 protein [Elusimicrobia bacterium]|nr:glycosyltransferase family 9 protein [Elusimicrobiota bacterium]
MNFLVVRFSSLGDVVLTSPVFENIKLNYPGSFVYFLTKKVYEPVFAENPFVDRIIPFEDFSFAGLIRHLKKIRPAVVFDLHSSLRSRLIDCFFPWKVSRVNLRRRERAGMLKGRTAEIPDAVKRYLETLTRKSFKIHTERVSLFVSEEETFRAKKMMERYGISPSNEIVVVGVQSKWKNKEWPHFRSFFEIAVKPGRFFVLVGDDFERAESLKPASRHLRNFVINLCGKLSLRTLFGIVSLSDCVISMDSAIAHIASAFSRPLIVFFGPTVPAFGFAPRYAKILEENVPCRPCHLHGGNICARGDRVCLASIGEKQLLEELERILK